MTEVVVLDASAMVAMLVGGGMAERVATRIRGAAVHVPAHFDAEVLSALGRINRDGKLSTADATTRIEALAVAPFERHALGPLLVAAWSLRDNARLVDALYVSLSNELAAPIITLDRGLAGVAPSSELLQA
jgi:predicted nucleic acid-binding protein